MQKTIEVMFENGVFKPLKKVKLPEHIRLTIKVLSEKDQTEEMESVAKKQSKALLSLAGVWSSGLRDVSENPDKYLYGTFKK